MNKISKHLDGWFIALIAVIGFWWLIAGGVRTPAAEIAQLKGSSNPDLWISALGSDDRTVRNYARENLLGALPDDALESIAVQSSESSDATEQLAGLWLLQRINFDGKGEIAARFLESENAAILGAAMNVLAADPVPDTHDKLLALTNDPSVEIRASALTALSGLADPDDLPIFISFLGRSNASVIEAAAKGIINIAPDNPRTAESLITTAYGSDLPAARLALKLLGEIGGPDALDSLFVFLEHGSVALASDASNAIGEIGGDEAGERALALFNTSSGRTRTQAARALHDIGVAGAQDYLWAAVLDDTNEFWLRYYSLEALSTCGNENLVPEIIDYIENTEPDDRLVRVGIEALGGMGGESVIGIYDAIIAGEIDLGLNRSGGQTALVAVISGLGRMDSDASRMRLRSLVESTEPEDFEILMGLIRAIGKVGAPEDVDLLQKLGQDKSVLRRDINEAVSSIEDRYPEEAGNGS